MDVRTEAAPAPADAPPALTIGESRWPIVISMLAFMAINIALRIWLPSESVAHLPFLLPAVEALLLVFLLTADPAHQDRRRLRRVALILVIFLVVAALWSTVILVHDLIVGRGVVNNADELLATGAVVWLGNILAFSLLYWLVDGGGPLARSQRSIPLDFAFTQHMSPELAPPGWRPVFWDYLHLGFTNATAFSPTDVMPLSLRGKYTMLVQSTVALALFGLVVARAVNAFT